MKILWTANILFPEQIKYIHGAAQHTGGWMHQFKKNIAYNVDCSLVICGFSGAVQELIHFKENNISFYIVPVDAHNFLTHDLNIDRNLEKIFREEKPDIIHIWGSEYNHSLSAMIIANKLQIANVVSIQGIISDIAKHYLAGLPEKLIKSYTLRDFVRQDNLRKKQIKFKKRGLLEVNLLKQARNAIGRTSYDFACLKEINPKINYYFCNECLRESFYEETCDIKKVEHSIFISQAYYPVKGFHYFLDALKIVKEVIPDVTVFVAGGFNPIIKSKKKIKKWDSYEKYIYKKIMKYNVVENIRFVGSLNEHEIKEYMLKSELFVSPSLIENSPNSVGEAMMLGLPVISSFVGGVPDMIEHGKEGMLYPYDQPSVLASYIVKMFEDKKTANSFAQKAKERSKNIFSVEVNTNNLFSIYETVINNERNV